MLRLKGTRRGRLTDRSSDTHAAHPSLSHCQPHAVILSAPAAPPPPEEAHSKTRLPWDILIHIVEFVPLEEKGDILSVIRTCRNFRLVGERMLYRDIELLLCPIRSLYFFRTLLQRPELGKHVRTYQPAPYFLRPRDSLDILPKFVQRRLKSRTARYESFVHEYTILVERVLDLVRNTNALALTCFCERVDETLKNMHSVRRYRMVHPLTSRTPYAPPGLDTVLDDIPLVTHLELPWSSLHDPYIGEIKPEHAPLLEELVAPLNVAEALIVDRPITRLFVLLEFQDVLLSPFDFLQNLTKGLHPIKVLGLSRHCAWDMIMASLVTAAAEHHPYIEELQLRLTFRGIENEILTAILDQFDEDLAKLGSLRTLDLNGSRSKGPKYFRSNYKAIDSWIFLPVLRKWHAACPTLSKVTFPNGSLWTVDPDGEWVCKNPKDFLLDRTICWCGSRIPGAEPWTNEGASFVDFKRPWPAELVVSPPHLDAKDT